MWFPIFLKSNLLSRLNNLKTRIAMKANIVMFFICVEVITYLLLCNLNDCTFNSKHFFFLRNTFFLLICRKKLINCSSSWNPVKISSFRNQVLRFIRAVETRSQNKLALFTVMGMKLNVLINTSYTLPTNIMKRWPSWTELEVSMDASWN